MIHTGDHVTTMLQWSGKKIYAKECILGLAFILMIYPNILIYPAKIHEKIFFSIIGNFDEIHLSKVRETIRTAIDTHVYRIQNSKNYHFFDKWRTCYEETSARVWIVTKIFRILITMGYARKNEWSVTIHFTHRNHW